MTKYAASVDSKPQIFSAALRDTGGTAGIRFSCESERRERKIK